VIAAAVVVVGLFLVGVVVDLLRVRSEINAGRDALTTLSADQLDRDLVPTIGSATAHLDRADQIADRSPFLSLLSVVPGSSAQIDGLRTLTQAAADLGGSARQAADAIDVDLENAGQEPAARLRLLATIARELDRVEAEVADIDLAEDHSLAGPLGGARAELRSELDRVPQRFSEARTRVRALRRVLEGPTRYLVLAANNAEMRGGAGMPLSAGILTIEDGDLAFDDFVPIANRWAGPIPDGLVPAEYARTYRQFRMGQSWLQTAASPNFATTGPIFDAMSSAFPAFGPVDGVMVVDTVTLRHLLQAIGPVEVDGFRYTAENVEQRLLNENYLRFDTSNDERSVRHDEQGDVATGIFDAIKSRNVPVASLTNALRTAAGGRHLLAYTEDDDIQAMFDEIGAGGALNPAALMVTVQNIAADKLDWYIDPSVTLRALRTDDSDPWTVRLTVRVPNPERSGNTSGVESYKEGYKAGIHRALVALYLPAQAFDIKSLDLDFSEAGADPPLWMVGKRIYIEEGHDKSVAVEFKLPPEHRGVLLLPSGRVRPMQVTVNGVVTNDAVPRALLFDPPDSEGFEPPSAAGVAAVLAVLGVATLVVENRRTVIRGRQRPLVAPSLLELRLPTVGWVLLVSAGVTLVASVLISVS
jgi:Protein of unknown function (DUF4012)